MKKVLVPVMDKVFAVPMEELEKFELSGQELESSQKKLAAISEAPEVEGQSYCDVKFNSVGQAWYVYEDGYTVRAWAHDKD